MDKNPPDVRPRPFLFGFLNRKILMIAVLRSKRLSRHSSARETERAPRGGPGEDRGGTRPRILQLDSVD
jgi:hypothetical protein